MMLKIIKLEDSIEIKNGEDQIEQYKMTETIDFNKLMNFLIGLELSEKIDYDCDSSKFDDQDKTLYSLLCDIKDNYNAKVDEYNTFVDTYNK